MKLFDQTQARSVMPSRQTLKSGIDGIGASTLTTALAASMSVLARYDISDIDHWRSPMVQCFEQIIWAQIKRHAESSKGSSCSVYRHVSAPHRNAFAPVWLNRDELRFSALAEPPHSTATLSVGNTETNSRATYTRRPSPPAAKFRMWLPPRVPIQTSALPPDLPTTAPRPANLNWLET